MTAAARRYPAVRHWMIWGEPTKASNFQPLRDGPRTAPARPRPARPAHLRAHARSRLRRAQGGRPLQPRDRRQHVHGRHRLAAPLDPGAAAARAAGRRGWTCGATTRSPRAARCSPRTRSAAASPTSATSTRSRAGSTAPIRRKLKLFLSEISFPTDHENFEFNFWMTREKQAAWIADALRETRRWRRIYTFGYLGLYDDALRPDGLPGRARAARARRHAEAGVRGVQGRLTRVRASMRPTERSRALSESELAREHARAAARIQELEAERDELESRLQRVESSIIWQTAQALKRTYRRRLADRAGDRHIAAPRRRRISPPSRGRRGPRDDRRAAAVRRARGLADPPGALAAGAHHGLRARDRRDRDRPVRADRRRRHRRRPR